MLIIDSVRNWVKLWILWVWLNFITLLASDSEAVPRINNDVEKENKTPPKTSEGAKSEDNEQINEDDEEDIERYENEGDWLKPSDVEGDEGDDSSWFALQHRKGLTRYSGVQNLLESGNLPVNALPSEWKSPSPLPRRNRDGALVVSRSTLIKSSSQETDRHHEPLEAHRPLSEAGDPEKIWASLVARYGSESKSTDDDSRKVPSIYNSSDNYLTPEEFSNQVGERLANYLARTEGAVDDYDNYASTDAAREIEDVLIQNMPISGSEDANTIFIMIEDEDSNEDKEDYFDQNYEELENARSWKAEDSTIANIGTTQENCCKLDDKVEDPGNTEEESISTGTQHSQNSKTKAWAFPSENYILQDDSLLLTEVEDTVHTEYDTSAFEVAVVHEVATETKELIIPSEGDPQYSSEIMEYDSLSQPAVEQSVHILDAEDAVIGSYSDAEVDPDATATEQVSITSEAIEWMFPAESDHEYMEDGILLPSKVKETECLVDTENDTSAFGVFVNPEVEIVPIISETKEWITPTEVDPQCSSEIMEYGNQSQPAVEQSVHILDAEDAVIGSYSDAEVDPDATATEQVSITSEAIEWMFPAESDHEYMEDGILLPSKVKEPVLAVDTENDISAFEVFVNPEVEIVPIISETKEWITPTEVDRQCSSEIMEYGNLSQPDVEQSVQILDAEDAVIGSFSDAEVDPDATATEQVSIISEAKEWMFPAERDHNYMEYDILSPTKVEKTVLVMDSKNDTSAFEVFVNPEVEIVSIISETKELIDPTEGDPQSSSEIMKDGSLLQPNVGESVNAEDTVIGYVSEVVVDADIRARTVTTDITEVKDDIISSKTGLICANTGDSDSDAKPVGVIVSSELELNLDNEPGFMAETDEILKPVMVEVSSSKPDINIGIKTEDTIVTTEHAKPMNKIPPESGESCFDVEDIIGTAEIAEAQHEKISFEDIDSIRTKDTAMIDVETKAVIACDTTGDAIVSKIGYEVMSSENGNESTSLNAKFEDKKFTHQTECERNSPDKDSDVLSFYGDYKDILNYETNKVHTSDVEFGIIKGTLVPEIEVVSNKSEENQKYENKYHSEIVQDLWATSFQCEQNNFFKEAPANAEEEKLKNEASLAITSMNVDEDIVSENCGEESTLLFQKDPEDKQKEKELNSTNSKTFIMSQETMAPSKNVMTNLELYNHNTPNVTKASDIQKLSSLILNSQAAIHSKVDRKEKLTFGDKSSSGEELEAKRASYPENFNERKRRSSRDLWILDCEKLLDDNENLESVKDKDFFSITYEEFPEDCTTNSSGHKSRSLTYSENDNKQDIGSKSLIDEGKLQLSSEKISNVTDTPLTEVEKKNVVFSDKDSQKGNVEAQTKFSNSEIVKKIETVKQDDNLRKQIKPVARIGKLSDRMKAFEVKEEKHIDVKPKKTFRKPRDVVTSAKCNDNIANKEPQMTMANSHKEVTSPVAAYFEIKMDAAESSKIGDEISASSVTCDIHPPLKNKLLGQKKALMKESNEDEIKRSNVAQNDISDRIELKSHMTYVDEDTQQSSPNDSKLMLLPPTPLVEVDDIPVELLQIHEQAETVAKFGIEGIKMESDDGIQMDYKLARKNEEQEIISIPPITNPFDISATDILFDAGASELNKESSEESQFSQATMKLPDNNGNSVVGYVERSAAVISLPKMDEITAQGNKLLGPPQPKLRPVAKKGSLSDRMKKFEKADEIGKVLQGQKPFPISRKVSGKKDDSKQEKECEKYTLHSSTIESGITQKDQSLISKSTEKCIPKFVIPKSEAGETKVSTEVTRGKAKMELIVKDSQSQMVGFIEPLNRQCLLKSEEEGKRYDFESKEKCIELSKQSIGRMETKLKGSEVSTPISLAKPKVEFETKILKKMAVTDILCSTTLKSSSQSEGLVDSVFSYEEQFIKDDETKAVKSSLDPIMNAEFGGKKRVSENDDPASIKGESEKPFSAEKDEELAILKKENVELPLFKKLKTGLGLDDLDRMMVREEFLNQDILDESHCDIESSNELSDELDDDIKDLLIPKIRRSKSRKSKLLKDIMRVPDTLDYYNKSYSGVRCDRNEYEEDVPIFADDADLTCKEDNMNTNVGVEKDLGMSIKNKYITEEEEMELNEIKKEEEAIRVAQRKELEKYLAMPDALTEKEQMELEEILAEEKTDNASKEASEARLEALLTEVRKRFGDSEADLDNDELLEKYINLPVSLTEDEELLLLSSQGEKTEADFKDELEYREYIKNTYLEDLEEERMRVEEEEYEFGGYYDDYHDEFEDELTEDKQESLRPHTMIMRDEAVGTDTEFYGKPRESKSFISRIKKKFENN